MEHPFADVIEALARAAAEDDGGASPFFGDGPRSYSIADLILEVRSRTDLGVRYAESWRRSHPPGAE